MVEKKGLGTLLPHLILWIGIAIVAFPVYLAFIASTHEPTIISNGQMPLTPGSRFLENYYRTIFIGTSSTTREPPSVVTSSRSAGSTMLCDTSGCLASHSALAVRYVFTPPPSGE